MKRKVLHFKGWKKRLILSDEMIRQLTEWFGPDEEMWNDQQIECYRKDVLDADGKVIGQTIGIRLPTK